MKTGVSIRADSTLIKRLDEIGEKWIRSRAWMVSFAIQFFVEEWEKATDKTMEDFTNAAK